MKLSNESQKSCSKILLATARRVCMFTGNTEHNIRILNEKMWGYKVIGQSHKGTFISFSRLFIPSKLSLPDFAQIYPDQLIE